MARSNADEPVQAETADGVLTITLNRPERGNGWTGAMTRIYFALLEQAARADDVRAIVVTGAGRAFCIGGDGEALDDAAASGAIGIGAPHPYWFPMRIGKPVIAAINGACFGIGLQQALVCDIRFASEDAKFSTAYARRGLVAEMGMSWLLPRLVGTGHAMDLMLSARLVRAPEAERMGLVNRIMPAGDLLAEAKAYAQAMAQQCSPRSMQAIKTQCYRDMMDDLPGSYARAGTMLDDAVTGQDFRKGIRSWQEGRLPQFPPLPLELALIDLES